mmetsp:Transcript_14064/g.44749  ORF Transcript_14064/g.44749 Transcript_14064/m.44749 type:complete len:223 (+) Transcript_14064:773-1441(+)
MHDVLQQRAHPVQDLGGRVRVARGAGRGALRGGGHLRAGLRAGGAAGEGVHRHRLREEPLPDHGRGGLARRGGGGGHRRVQDRRHCCGEGARGVAGGGVRGDDRWLGVHGGLRDWVRGGVCGAGRDEHGDAAAHQGQGSRGALRGAVRGDLPNEVGQRGQLDDGMQSQVPRQRRAAARGGGLRAGAGGARALTSPGLKEGRKLVGPGGLGLLSNYCPPHTYQ